MASLHRNINEKIHPSAIIEEGAKIGENTVIGPYSIIKAGVVLGKNNYIGPHVVIEGNTYIGDNNEFYQFTSIGSIPQVVKWEAGKSELHIGNNNIFREYVTVQPGLEQFGGMTKIGDHNLMMISSHIGHDCYIGNHNRFTNYVGVSGHVVVGHHVIIGGFSGIHQHVQIGDYAFVGAGSMVTLDVPIYCLVQGNHASLIKINNVGLVRQNFTAEEITELQTIFRKLFFMDGNNLDEKLDLVTEEFANSNNAQQLFKFIKATKRGICSYHKRAARTEA